MFYQRIASLGLSIEEGTASVPQDGRYYVLSSGHVDRSYRTLSQAIRRYEALKAALADRTAESA